MHRCVYKHHTYFSIRVIDVFNRCVRPTGGAEAQGTVGRAAKTRTGRSTREGGAKAAGGGASSWDGENESTGLPAESEWRFK